MCLNLKNLPPRTPISPRERLEIQITVIVLVTDLLAIALIGMQSWLEGR